MPESPSAVSCHLRFVMRSSTFSWVRATTSSRGPGRRQRRSARDRAARCSAVAQTASRSWSSVAGSPPRMGDGQARAAVTVARCGSATAPPCSSGAASGRRRTHWNPTCEGRRRRGFQAVQPAFAVDVQSTGGGRPEIGETPRSGRGGHLGLSLERRAERCYARSKTRSKSLRHVVP